MSSATATRASASKAEHARAAIADSLDRLGEALAAGNSEQMTEFLSIMSRFHRYSFGNVMLIMTQRPDATRVAGFRMWKSLGRSVKKGEKGIVILAPMMLKARRDDGDDSRDDARDGDSERGRKVLRFRAVHVFDISQTEGEPLPEPSRVSGDPAGALDRLEQAVRAHGVELSESDDLGAADGVSRGGRIEIAAGLSPAERFATLVHEFAHELLHQAKGETKPPKVVRELEAEAVAFVVAEWAGLENTHASADYIRLYQGDTKTLAASLDRITTAADTIITAIDPEAPSRGHGRTTETPTPPKEANAR